MAADDKRRSLPEILNITHTQEQIAKSCSRRLDTEQRATRTNKSSEASTSKQQQEREENRGNLSRIASTTKRVDLIAPFYEQNGRCLLDATTKQFHF